MGPLKSVHYGHETILKTSLYFYTVYICKCKSTWAEFIDTVCVSWTRSAHCQPVINPDGLYNFCGQACADCIQ